MHELNLLDETLDLNQSPSYHLSIQVSPDGFSFVILDLVRNKYVALRHYDLEPGLPPDRYLDRIEEIIEKDDFLGTEFKSVYLLCPSARYTLVPAPLFRKDRLKLYFSFNHPMEELDELHYNSLRNANAYLIYALPGELGNTLVRHFRQAAFFHPGVPMIEHLLTTPGNKAREHTVSLHLERESLDLAVHGEKQLRFFNTFRHSHPHDVLFFLMYVMEQMKLDQEKTGLLLSGQIEKTSETYQLLKQYVREVRFSKPNEVYTYSYTFQEVPSHLFVNLLNLYPCA